MRFKNVFKFSNLLSVYPYNYMDEWEKFNERSLPKCSNLNMEGITESDDNHARRVCEHLKKIA